MPDIFDDLRLSRGYGVTRRRRRGARARRRGCSRRPLLFRRARRGPRGQLLVNSLVGVWAKWISVFLFFSPSSKSTKQDFQICFGTPPARELWVNSKRLLSHFVSGRAARWR